MPKTGIHSGYDSSVPDIQANGNNKEGEVGRSPGANHFTISITGGRVNYAEFENALTRFGNSTNIQESNTYRHQRGPEQLHKNMMILFLKTAMCSGVSGIPSPPFSPPVFVSVFHIS